MGIDNIIAGMENTGHINHCFSAKMMASITLFIRSVLICPIFLKTICLSAVKIRKGRINESMGNEPDTKSSALTNLSMRHLLQGLTNLLPKRFRLKDRFALYLPSFGEEIQPVPPICVLTSKSTLCCFSTCCVSSKYPLFNNKIKNFLQR